MSDVLTELDAHLRAANNSVDYVIEWRRELLIGLLQRARDEIVVLRIERDRLGQFVDGVKHHVAQARATALEEAALMVDEYGTDPLIAGAIRALK